MDSSNAIEAGKQESVTGKLSSAEQERSGLERFLDTLGQPTLEDRENLNDYYEKVEINRRRWSDAPNGQRKFQDEPLNPGTVRLGLDPHSRDLVLKESCFILKELMPQVVANVVKILEKQPDIDRTRGTKEFFAKRTADLKSLLSFDFMPVGRTMNHQEQRQLSYALSVIYYMTDGEEVTRYTGGLYRKGIDQLTREMGSDPSYTHTTEAQRPDVVEQLSEQAKMVNRTLGLVYGWDFRNLPHAGMVDGSGDGRRVDALTFYARRVDPQFYIDYEDRMLGLAANQEKVEKPERRPRVIK